MSGVQTTEWKLSRNDPPGPCSIGYRGAGAERVEFRSTKPARIEVYAMPGLRLTVKSPDARSALPSLPITAHTKRRGTFKEWSNGGGAPCGTGGDRSPPPPTTRRDCGTRTSTWDLTLGSSLTSDGVRLFDGETRPFEVFHDCPVGEFGFPAILTGNRYGRDIVAPLRQASVFRRTRTTLRTVGHGTLHFHAGGEASYNTIEWVVTLRRARG